MVVGEAVVRVKTVVVVVVVMIVVVVVVTVGVMTVGVAVAVAVMVVVAVMGVAVMVVGVVELVKISVTVEKIASIMVSEAIGIVGNALTASSVGSTHIIRSTNIDGVGRKINISNFIVGICLIASEFSDTSVKIIRCTRGWLSSSSI